MIHRRSESYVNGTLVSGPSMWNPPNVGQDMYNEIWCPITNIKVDPCILRVTWQCDLCSEGFSNLWATFTMSADLVPQFAYSHNSVAPLVNVKINETRQWHVKVEVMDNSSFIQPEFSLKQDTKLAAFWSRIANPGKNL